MATFKRDSIDPTRQSCLKLTSLSPSLSTLQCKKAVCPIVTVMFLCTSKSKYGIKYEEAGSMVDDTLQDSEMKSRITKLIDGEIDSFWVNFMKVHWFRLNKIDFVVKTYRVFNGKSQIFMFSSSFLENFKLMQKFVCFAEIKSKYFCSIEFHNFKSCRTQAGERLFSSD